MGQQFNIHHCYDGGRSDILNSSLLLENGSTLNTLRTNSFQGDFPETITPDSLTYYKGKTWLLKLSNQGDTLWKFSLPYSERTANTFYYTFFPFGTFKDEINDFAYPVQTIKEDKVILHYVSYADFERGDVYSVLNRPILYSGILHLQDGEALTSVFAVDTLIHQVNDTALQTYNYVINKCNDSIYDLAVSLLKTIPYSGFGGGVSYYYQTRFYKIDYKNRQVLTKKVYDNQPYVITYNQENFFIYYSDLQHLFLYKLNDSFNEMSSVVIPDISAGQDVSKLITILQNGNLMFATTQEIGINRFVTILNTVDKDNLTYVSQEFDMGSATAEYSSNYITLLNFDLSYIYNPWGYPFFSSATEPSSRYKNALLSHHSYEDSAIYRNFLLRIDRSNGTVNWAIELDASASYSNSRLTDTGFYLLESKKVYIDQIPWEIYFNSIEKYDDTPDLLWRTSLPDTITLEGNLYQCVFYPDYNYHYRYGKKIIISAQYKDTSQNNPDYRTLFFSLTSATGDIARLQLPDSVEKWANINYTGYTPADYNSYLGSNVYFFEDETGTLYILAQNKDQCSSNSGFDIVIYKFQDVISNLPTEIKSVKNSFQLYPNPSVEKITIRLDKEGSSARLTYKVLDVMGKLHNTGVIGPAALEHTIDISALSGGTYILIVGNENEFSAKTFVKVK